MFRAHVLIIRRSKLHYTASGIIRPIGGHLVHETATYMSDDTRGCVMQFWPPDDEHICSKHVEAWNKTYCKTKILCIKLVNYWVNILRCRVSKTSKFVLFHSIVTWCSLKQIIPLRVLSEWDWYTPLSGDTSIFYSNKSASHSPNCHNITRRKWKHNLEMQNPHPSLIFQSRRYRNCRNLIGI